MRFSTKTRSELANEYGVSRKTFYNWIKRENIKLNSGYILPIKVKEIYTKFGHPNEAKVLH